VIYVNQVTRGKAKAGSIAVKTVVLDNVDITAKLQAANLQSFTYELADLAAGGDLAATPVFVVPAGYKFTLVAVNLIAKGDDAGIDAANTSVFTLAVGATAKAGFTFDGTAGKVYPDNGASKALTISDAALAAGDVLTVAVTNGATADTPASLVQVTGYFEKA